MAAAIAVVMAVVTNYQSRGKGRPLLEAESGATTDSSPELQWSEDRISGGKGLVSGWRLRGITLSYDRPGQRGGVLCQW